MKRRAFIALSGAVAAWPVLGRMARAQVPVVGVLSVAPSSFMWHFMPSVRRGMQEIGYVEGENFRFQYRGADGDYARLGGLAAGLVADNVAIVLAAGGLDPIRAAVAATKTTPIVFVTAADPVMAGLVESLGRPGANVTGVSLVGSELEAKRLEILNQIVPGDAPIGVLVNPDYPAADQQIRQLNDAATALSRRLSVEHARTAADIEAKVAVLVQRGVRGLLVTQDQFLNSRSEQIVALAARYGLPGIYNERRFAEAGGLLTYGANFQEGYHQVGLYLGKILHGTRPADLPVLQPTSFELVINLKAAKAMGLAVPAALLARADEVIE